MVQDFSGQFGWNGKRGIRLKISILSETFRKNDLYHLNLQPELSIFVDKWF